MRNARTGLAGAAVALLLVSCTDEPTTDPGTDDQTTEASEETTTPSDGTTEPSEETTTPSEDQTAEDGDGDDGASDDGNGSAAPEDPATIDVPWGTDTRRDPDWPSGGGDLLPTNVRTGAHLEEEHPEPFERVVFELEGSGEPGYQVEYVDSAVEQGRGREIDVEGDHVLEVVITGTRYPSEDESDRMAQGSYASEDTDLVEEVVVTGVFEGQTQAFIGTDEAAPFRVLTLTDPARLVVDVRTGEG
ncbi:hypothetical protein GCM10023169_32770 [Georgenia halophila]|uniref:AMIN-like domain-containing protein n=1 Tax=Georgenia halophila TaxID=620889 RepID=A0ABP8LKD9_9MICO